MAFERFLKAARAARKLSKEDLSHRAGLDRTYVSPLERCIYNPTIDIIEQIADVLETSPAEIPKALGLSACTRTSCGFRDGTGRDSDQIPDTVPI